MENSKKKILVLGGPTAVGKTELSINLAKRLNGEIISADSMQIYKYMDIGSAKVTKEEMQGIKHYMIDIITPDQGFSVSDYKEMGQNIIKKIHSENKLPIIVGGTGLYINSLTCNMNFTDAGKDEEYRLYLEKVAEKKGNEYVHELLKNIDIVSYNNIHPNNLKKVIRALEVYKLTNKPFSSFDVGDEIYKSEYDIHYFVLNMNREKLYSRINKRVDIMLQKGLVYECRHLKELGYTSDMQSMQGIGYKEILNYLDCKIGYDDAIELIKKGSRHYAKRQLTWFRRDKRAKFLDKDLMSDKEIEDYIINDLNQ